MDSGSDIDSTTNKVHVEQELHVETAVPSSEDDLDLDLNKRDASKGETNTKRKQKSCNKEKAGKKSTAFEP